MTTLGVERGNAVNLQGLADSPPAQRVQKPKWTQFRFLAGVLLVVGSVLLGAKVVAGADQSSFALVAVRPLAVGMTVSQSDVRSVKVRFYDNQQQYRSGTIPDGYVVLRPVGENEFIPASAFGTPADLAPENKSRLVTVPVAAGHYPSGVAGGDVVDVYATTDSGSSGAGTTTLLLAGVRVNRGTTSSSGSPGGSSNASIQLVIPEDRVPELVVALQNDKLDIVAVQLAARAR
ncbi:MAG: hypothetical protein JWM93_489 [Frankiales bacterium]|nr:hypothetical protein [Frankiales bacterium]